jgi:AcrR family transcriptional regulator
MAGATPKEALLAAVLDVALADGIADKSLRAIAEAAGTSHRMLIHHFGSKEALLVEVIRAVEARQRSALAALHGDPAEVGPAFWAHLRSPELAAHERLFFEIYGQALRGRSWATPLLDGIVEDWAEPLAAAFATSGATFDRSRVLARLCVAVSRGLLLDVLATGDEVEVDAAMDCFAHMLNTYLAGTRAL